MKIRPFGTALFHADGQTWRILRTHHKSVEFTVRLTVHTARVPAPHNHSHHKQCRTPYAAVHTLVLLMMGIMMHETCWDRSLVINIRLVASCWFLSLHPTFMMHGHKSLKTISFFLSVRQHGTTLFQLDGYSYNLILNDFSKICREHLSLIKT